MSSPMNLGFVRVLFYLFASWLSLFIGVCSVCLADKFNTFGVRIESTLAVTPVKVSQSGTVLFYSCRRRLMLNVCSVLQTKGETKDGPVWLSFERLTCVPIQTKMVKESMLSKEEKQWIKVRDLPHFFLLPFVDTPRLTDEGAQPAVSRTTRTASERERRQASIKMDQARG